MSSEEEFEFDPMTPELQRWLEHRETYQERYQKDEVKEWRAEGEALESRIPAGLKELYFRGQKEWICRDETAVGAPRVERSASGRYELDITQHTRGGPGWHYSKARVLREGALLTVVCRNYSAFPFLFIEGHPNGHDYLICGEDYQGQTVVELTTGRRGDFLPAEASRGHGFCWAAYRFDAASRILVVDGCYWACPYEVKFFDFSDPMEKGWPEIVIEGDPWLEPAEWEGHRKNFDWWCPDFKEKETLWSRRIHEGRSRSYTIDLEWAVETGPIKLVIFKDGKTDATLFFPHSVAGMSAAFDHAKALLAG